MSLPLSVIQKKLVNEEDDDDDDDNDDNDEDSVWMASKRDRYKE